MSHYEASNIYKYLLFLSPSHLSQSIIQTDMKKKHHFISVFVHTFDEREERKNEAIFTNRKVHGTV